MSTLVENVAKVTAAHAALKEAIAAKGGAVPEGTKLTDMPYLVKQITAEQVPTNPRAVFARDKSDRIVVPEMLVVDTIAMTDLVGCFLDCWSLTSLSLPTGFGQAAINNGLFLSRCYALTTITGNPNFKSSIDFSDCQNLTHDSLMVVINGLQTVTTKQTLTLGSTNLAKLTDDEKKVATDKGWTLE